MFSKTNTLIYRLDNKRVEILFEKVLYQCAVKNAAGTFSIVTFAQDEP